MLTSIGRAAARRTICGRAPTPSTSVLTNAHAHARAAAPRYTSLRAALPIRSFTVSAWRRQPASSAAVPKTKAKTAATKKKTAAKKAAKPKAKAKKVAAPKKKKKVLSPEEKEKVQMRETKKMALLKTPTLLPETAWTVYVSKNVNNGKEPLGDKIREVSANYKSLSSSEKEQLQSTSDENRASNVDTRRAWVDSHPPEAIYLANLARRRLAKKLNKSRMYLIHDERLPKRAPSPYILFIKSRFPRTSAEGSAQDAMRSMAAEWKTLSDSDKEPFKDMASADAAKSREALQSLREKAKVYWAAQKQGGAVAENQSSYPSP